MNAEHIERFYKLLSHEAPIEIRAIAPGNPPRIIYAESAERLRQICEDLNGKFNLYAGLNERECGIKTAAKAQNITRYRVLLIDIDPIREKKERAKDEQTKKAIDYALGLAHYIEETCNIGPFHVACSGNGAHLLLSLPGETSIAANEGQEIASRLHKVAQNILFSTTHQLEFRIDSTFDPPRISKIIGTNTIDGQETYFVERQSSYNGLKLNFDVLLRFLKPSVYAWPEQHRRWWGGLDLQDRSKAIYGITAKLLEEGIKADEVNKILLEWDTRTGQRAFDRGSERFKEDLERITSKLIQTDLVIRKTTPKKEDKYTWVFPPSGFISDFISVGTASSDASPHLFLFAGLCAIAAIISDKAYIKYGLRPLYPNLYTILLAPSGYGRKTSVINYTKEVIVRSCPNDPEALVLPDNFSGEGLFSALQEQSTGIILWSEFSQVLKAFTKDYQKGTKELITELYDCPPPPIKKRLAQKSYSITKQPCVTILAASNPAWFSTSITDTDLSGGLLGRFLICPPDSTLYRPYPSSPDIEAVSALAEQLTPIRAHGGVVSISLPAKELYEKFATNLYNHSQSADTNVRDYISTFTARWDALALKLSLLFQFSQSPSSEIQEESMQLAIATLSNSFRYLEHELTKGGMNPSLNKKAERLADVIGKHPGIARRDLYYKSGISNKKELEDAIAYLIDSERIVKQSVSTKTKPKETFYLREAVEL